jgi:prolyl-tRNA synthetase
VRCTTCDYAANTRPSACRAAGAAVRRRARGARRGHPDTPTIDTLVKLSNDRADLRRADREWTAADT